MQWFIQSAPIRLKLLLAFGLLWGVTVFVDVMFSVVGGTAGWTMALAATVFAAVACVWFREAIAGPYVTTVVRMEALAAGDLDSPIQFTTYGDCIGRLTQAIFTFKDAAAKQIELNAESERNAAVVRTMSANMEKLAGGDLTADITAEFPDSYAGLKSSFNVAIGSLRGVIAKVANGADAIGTGSSEIAQASEDLARRTESNAASLEQTSAALVEIENRLKASAMAAEGTVARADRAYTSVSTGRELAENAKAAMTRVSSSAHGIDDVIEGLDKIAFQTRVLAMNAAVEAGRAGDAGRGFAVVADLVSALAIRAEEEAKRARDQLSFTQTEIMIAVEAVEKVDGAFADISVDVGEVTSLVAGMAADNVAQSYAVSEITAAVGSMDAATQQNAAMVEQTSAAARNLMSEVSALAVETAHFRFGSGPAVHRHTAKQVKTPPTSYAPARANSTFREDKEHEATWTAF